MTDDTLTVEYVSLDELLKWPGNAKQHDVGAIALSVLKYGFRDPLGVNGRNHVIEEGHGRLDTLAALRRQRRPAPRFVRVNERGDWLVPVLYFDDDEVTQHGYTLAHNRTHDLGGGYDTEKLFEALLEQLQRGQLSGTGYDAEDVEALRKKLEAQAAGGGTSAAEASGQSLDVTYRIIIECQDETQQAELLEQFQRDGLTCRALMT